MNSQLLRQRLIDTGLADSESIRGCSLDEVSQIEQAAQRSLPASYADFMSQFGKRAGRFLRDVDIFFPEVLSLHSVALDILKDNEDDELLLPQCTLVFAVRNKEQFLCFFGDGDNPSVKYYMSGDPGFSTVAQTFWDFIADELCLCEENYRKIKNTPYDLRF